MLQYKDYLKKFVENYYGLTEKEFDEIANLFPNIKEIDWDGYYVDEDLIYYILESLLKPSNAYIEEYWTSTKTVELSYVDSLDDLEKINKCLTHNGWTINNLDEIKEEIKEENRRNLESKIRESLIQELKDNATLEQLKGFCNSLT